MIPAEAAEAVAIAWVGEREWQAHSEAWRLDRLEDVGQILEAAASHIAAAKAESWDEGVQAQKAWTWNDDMEPLTNPYKAAGSTSFGRMTTHEVDTQDSRASAVGSGV